MIYFPSDSACDLTNASNAIAPIVGGADYPYALRYVHCEQEWSPEGPTGGIVGVFDDGAFFADLQRSKDIAASFTDSMTLAGIIARKIFIENMLSNPAAFTAYATQALAAWHSPKGWSDPSIAWYWV